jgi:hypothetical protein
MGMTPERARKKKKEKKNGGDKVLLNPDEQSKLVNYMIEATREVVKLNDEIIHLERMIDFDVGAYERYKRLIGARDAIREQIKQIEELLSSG